MPQRQPELRYGRIIWAVLQDARGFKKERPAIILTQTAEISTESPLVVMAVTTTFADPPPEHHVPLPWHPDPRRVGTRLAQRSAAVITWLDTLYPEEVIDVKGQVPVSLMREIQEKLFALRDRDNQNPSAADPRRT